MAKYELTLKGTFECHESETDDWTAKAIKALEEAGFVECDEVDLDETDYDMTAKQIVEEFEENILPSVVAQYGNVDAVAKREAFNNWTDMLCKEGTITDWQYETIDNPY